MDPQFKLEFWIWFDLLPLAEKKRFWYYQQDAAEVFFYNKVWSKRQLSVDISADMI